MSSNCPLLEKLPFELREKIYQYAYEDWEGASCLPHKISHDPVEGESALRLTCHQIRKEADDVFMKTAYFAFNTPSQALEWISANEDLSCKMRHLELRSPQLPLTVSPQMKTEMKEAWSTVLARLPHLWSLKLVHDPHSWMWSDILCYEDGSCKTAVSRMKHLRTFRYEELGASMAEPHKFGQRDLDLDILTHFPKLETLVVREYIHLDPVQIASGNHPFTTLTKLKTVEILSPTQFEDDSISILDQFRPLEQIKLLSRSIDTDLKALHRHAPTLKRLVLGDYEHGERGFWKKLEHDDTDGVNYGQLPRLLLQEFSCLEELKLVAIPHMDLSVFKYLPYTLKSVDIELTNNLRFEVACEEMDDSMHFLTNNCYTLDKLHLKIHYQNLAYRDLSIDRVLDQMRKLSWWVPDIVFVGKGALDNGEYIYEGRGMVVRKDKFPSPSAFRDF
ncbi:MAG: hypothetical protein M4579_003962 [Chaenotheca gracillima]|nr:MAG: hypothetical protein M4579_003962 [Chaenotheca gracillima]